MSEKNPPLFSSGSVGPFGPVFLTTEVTLRDLFATAALNALSTGKAMAEMGKNGLNVGLKDLSKACYVLADAMLEARRER